MHEFALRWELLRYQVANILVFFYHFYYHGVDILKNINNDQFQQYFRKTRALLFVYLARLRRHRFLQNAGKFLQIHQELFQTIFYEFYEFI